jgi:hypothetical protein
MCVRPVRGVRGVRLRKANTRHNDQTTLINMLLLNCKQSIYSVPSTVSLQQLSPYAGADTNDHVACRYNMHDLPDK